MKDRIKEHNRDMRLAHTQTSTVSEHALNTGHYPLWDEVKIYRQGQRGDSHKTSPNKRESGTEIPEAWMPTIKKHNNRRVVKTWTPERTAHQNSED